MGKVSLGIVNQQINEKLITAVICFVCPPSSTISPSKTLARTVRHSIIPKIARSAKICQIRIEKPGHASREEGSDQKGAAWGDLDDPGPTYRSAQSDRMTFDWSSEERGGSHHALRQSRARRDIMSVHAM